MQKMNNTFKKHLGNREYISVFKVIVWNFKHVLVFAASCKCNGPINSFASPAVCCFKMNARGYIPPNMILRFKCLKKRFEGDHPYRQWRPVNRGAQIESTV